MSLGCLSGVSRVAQSRPAKSTASLIPLTSTRGARGSFVYRDLQKSVLSM